MAPALREEALRGFLEVSELYQGWAGTAVFLWPLFMFYDLHPFHTFSLFPMLFPPFLP